MADITKIVLPDNTEYDVKDANAVDSTTTRNFTVSETEPSTPQVGDIWIDSHDAPNGNLIKIKDSSTWGQIRLPIATGEVATNFWGDTNPKLYYIKYGRLVTLRLMVDFSSARTNYVMGTNATLPAFLTPYMNYRFSAVAYLNSNAWGSGTLYPCVALINNSSPPTISFTGNNTEMKKCMGIQFSATYIANNDDYE